MDVFEKIEEKNLDRNRNMVDGGTIRNEELEKSSSFYLNIKNRSTPISTTAKAETKKREYFY